MPASPALGAIVRVLVTTVESAGTAVFVAFHNCDRMLQTAEPRCATRTPVRSGLEYDGVDSKRSPLGTM